MFETKVLQILQKLFIDFHSPIPGSKSSIEFSHWSLEEAKYQMLGPKYVIQLELFQTVFTLNVSMKVICNFLFDKEIAKNSFR